MSIGDDDFKVQSVGDQVLFYTEWDSPDDTDVTDHVPLIGPGMVNIAGSSKILGQLVQPVSYTSNVSIQTFSTGVSNLHFKATIPVRFGAVVLNETGSGDYVSGYSNCKIKRPI